VLIIGEIYTLQAPYLNKSNFFLVLVHHVKITKTRDGPSKIVEYGSPEEHIFAFILGFRPRDVSDLVDLLRIFWEKPITKPELRGVGLTTRLFLAAALKVYGFREAENSVRKAFGKFEAIYNELKSPKRESEKAVSEQNVPAEGEKKTMTEDERIKKWKEEFDKQIKSCTKLSL
jgi:hypothetical protein